MCNVTNHGNIIMIIIKEQNEHIPKAIAIVSSALSLPTNSLTSSFSHNQLALMPV